MNNKKVKFWDIFGDLLVIVGSIGIIVIALCMHSLPLFFGVMGWGILALDKLIGLIK